MACPMPRPRHAVCTARDALINLLLGRPYSELLSATSFAGLTCRARPGGLPTSGRTAASPTPGISPARRPQGRVTAPRAEAAIITATSAGNLLRRGSGRRGAFLVARPPAAGAGSGAIVRLGRRQYRRGRGTWAGIRHGGGAPATVRTASGRRRVLWVLVGAALVREESMAGPRCRRQSHSLWRVALVLAGWQSRRPRVIGSTACGKLLRLVGDRRIRLLRRPGVGGKSQRASWRRCQPKKTGRRLGRTPE